MSKLDTIKKILSEQLGVDESAITADTSIEDLGADSLDIVEIIMNIEEEFGITVDDSAVETLKKVGDIVNYIPEN